jgi:hypothetical protein
MRLHISGWKLTCIAAVHGNVGRWLVRSMCRGVVRGAGGEHGTKQTGADQRGRSEGHYTLTYEDIFGA